MIYSYNNSCSIIISIIVLMSFTLLFSANSYCSNSKKNRDLSATLRKDKVRIVGSSSAMPHVNLAAELFDATSKAAILSQTKEKEKEKEKEQEQETGITPKIIVESTGSGGGIRIFCSKKINSLRKGFNSIDNCPVAVITSRRMNEAEKLSCKKNNHHISENILGKGALVVATYTSNKKNSPIMNNITIDELFKALNKSIYKGGKWIQNPNRLWSDIDPKLPPKPIVVLGPSYSSGAYTTFIEKIFTPIYKLMETPKEHMGIRRDKAYIHAGDQEAVIVEKLKLRNDAIGIIDYGYYLINKDTLHAIKIDGITATRDSIVNSKYKLIREFYIYHKTNSKHTARIVNFMNFTRQNIIQDILSRNGLIVLSREQT